MRVLVVTPQDDVRRALTARLSRSADVDGCRGFSVARPRLVSTPYDWLMTDLRLGEYNGLHLVHLTHIRNLPTRALVFASEFDAYLAGEAQEAGAFYEHVHRVVAAAPAYLRVALPERDRRDVLTTDRRSVPRGGRRAADLAVLSFS